MKTVAYSKLGRAWNLDPARASTVGGDLDCIRLLTRLAWEHPDWKIVLVGRNSGEDPASLGYPDNVVNPWSWPGFKMPTVSYERIKSEGRHYVESFLRTWRELSGGLPAVDHHVMWLGQHGGSNSPIPFVDTDWRDGNLTTPQMAFVNYCSYLLDYTQSTGVEPVLLCPDPRNYLKAREMLPVCGEVVGQYDMDKETKYEMFDRWTGDGSTPVWAQVPPGRRAGSCWVSSLRYRYGGLELTALDEPPAIEMAREPGRHEFGVISNENRKEVGAMARLPLLRDWVLRWAPDAPVFGTWTPDSAMEIARHRTELFPLPHALSGPQPLPTSQMYEALRTFRSTFTMPASGSGWATAKPWECFAAGTVCFFHPKYDDQGHVLPLRSDQSGRIRAHHTEHARKLANFLRVRSPADLQQKVALVARDDDLWVRVVADQRFYFEHAFGHWRGGARAVEERLDS